MKCVVVNSREFVIDNMSLKQINFNQDLVNERKKCSFNIEELTNYLDGGVEYTAKRRDIDNKVLRLKGLTDEIPEEYLSHKEKYENAIRKVVTMYNAIKNDEAIMDDSNSRSLVGNAVFKDISPFALHFSMFIPTILGQANEEQQAYWLKRARNFEIIGTYAQTELGHGTFIRGLETTAEYDQNTEEFILNSPTLTSYKWWPGGLAHTANYCVVMAQLQIEGKNHGIQLFIVQLRDEETHIPLPGIKLGEIGAKLGFNTANNGFLGFDHHRIPRDRMLMKNNQVTKDGKFIASNNNKLTYGTMVFVRVFIVTESTNNLARAATIATRYSAVRHQSQIKPDEPEPQVIDYVTQQHKLFSAIATSYSTTIIARRLWTMYDKMIEDLTIGKVDRLPELHSLACCLKAVSSSDATTMTERLRLACGGHGYMLSSNLPQIYGLLTASCTYEGENTVLLLQTARSLVKAYQSGLKGNKLPESMTYLMDKSPLPEWDNSVIGIGKGFQRAASREVASCVANLQKHIQQGLSPEDAWNRISVQLISASELHCRAFIMTTLQSELQRTTGSLSDPVKKVLFQLAELYTIYWALEKLGKLLLCTTITENNVHELQQKYEKLLAAIRPNAVGLVDAFDYRDEIICSTLGSYDGRVYERLMEEALKSPLNKEPVNESFHKYLKPFMQGKL